MNTVREKKKTCDTFFAGFPSALCFNKSTFSDNQKRWLFADREARDIALKANKTDAGRWFVFATMNSSKKSNLRAAKCAL